MFEIGLCDNGDGADVLFAEIGNRRPLNWRRLKIIPSPPHHKAKDFQLIRVVFRT